MLLLLLLLLLLRVAALSGFAAACTWCFVSLCCAQAATVASNTTETAMPVMSSLAAEAFGGRAQIIAYNAEGVRVYEQGNSAAYTRQTATADKFTSWRRRQL
ncbi:hypothetical protein SYNPS1DRAFT_30893 [Syncephalis pseudoplumigaleata]|uniref:Secreted protein n=1 Tax=Syncephalis pseudoplumigaleata TaxID=1712513 RepID=A0A4P9YWQ3_9FUNG|nr:hypothetical protein SYNPS1DRAFT_30893 [Syncephalis pseudoplumigaleata]|eukprot:RKP23370.1 hypothetical protein SYNPS1DRAFT_30893 [Syncephalis pseudoplumigaleata]